MSSDPASPSQDELPMTGEYHLTLKGLTASPAGQQGVAPCRR